MASDPFGDLLRQMPSIAKAVNAFTSESVQQEAFRAFLDALGPSSAESDEGQGRKSAQGKTIPSPKARKGEKTEVPRAEPAKRVPTTEIVNTMKQRDDFKSISDKVLHKRDVWNKIRLVLYFAGGPMTSREIASVLNGLELKTDQPAVSNKLKQHHADVIASGVRKKGLPTRYKLSAPARNDTQTWLNETLK